MKDTSRLWRWMCDWSIFILCGLGYRCVLYNLYITKYNEVVQLGSINAQFFCSRLKSKTLFLNMIRLCISIFSLLRVSMLAYHCEIGNKKNQIQAYKSTPFCTFVFVLLKLNSKFKCHQYAGFFCNKHKFEKSLSYVFLIIYV